MLLTNKEMDEIAGGEYSQLVAEWSGTFFAEKGEQDHETDWRMKRKGREVREQGRSFNLNIYCRAEYVYRI